MVEQGKTDAGDIIKAIEDLAGVDPIEIERGDHEKASVLVVPKGKVVQSIKSLLDEYRLTPERRKGTAELQKLESFIEHVNRHKDDDSVVFAQADVPTSSASLTAILNYNRMGPERPGGSETPDTSGRARFGDHRAIYRFPVSEEWKAWTSKVNPMPLPDFAEFLEEHVVDVMSVEEAMLRTKIGPEFAAEAGISLAGPQDLLQTSRGIAIKSDISVRSATRLSSGEVQMQFSEEHKGDGGGQLNIPAGFLISIPVFRGEAPYAIPVRFRYRLQGAGVLVWFAFSRLQRVWDQNVTDACDKVADQTKLPLFYGKPEA